MSETLPAKSEVRRRILAARSALTLSERERLSAAIVEGIEHLDAYRSAETILFYMPIKGEADVVPLMRRAIAEGRRCVLPRCCPGRSLSFSVITNLDDDLEPGTWGIPEPKDCISKYTATDFSAIIVPGVAFDRKGCRIGYGAGYYDRLLCGIGESTVKIAPAFALQVVPELPAQQHDVPVDVIVTETKILNCRRARGEIDG